MRHGSPRRNAGRRCVRATERGAGTVLVVGLVMVLMILLASVLLLAQAAVAARRAATAADQSALAAADAARGLAPGEPCRVAGEVAGRNGARLAACTIEGTRGEIVEVRTEVRGPPLLPAATGHARAGPPPDSVLPG
ncbi:Rv3654c family TadE-like protein [Specibacter cremeus]|uniref:Rv3654c family TadE-like protein n=1 Tax=Specibacter cremeus TaxID=1629051 RepID=UPI000F79783D|nr:Rv3654c family TadE-like protein [Specibacter cremeus]